MGDFIGSIQPGDLDNDIAFYFIDVNNSLHRSQAFDAAMSLVPGEVVSCDNCWVVAKFIDSVETDFHTKLAALQPHWWPKFSASFVVTGVRTGCPPRYVYFKTAPPTAEYINPIRRKAEKFQGATGVPFIIALEGSNLPNVYLQIESEIENYWKLWEHVSGIMVYEPRFWAVGTHKTYVWKLLNNPYASKPLPMLFPVSTGNNEKLDMYILEPEKIRIQNA